MIFVLMIICVIVFAFSYASCSEGMEFISGIFLAVIFSTAIILMVEVGNGKTIDERISMYKEENKKIEDQMDILVSQYMDYESDTFNKLKNENSVTLVNLYPELKSDELIKKQIEIYENNNNKIKKLKEDKIDLKTKKWWLYFGH